MGSFTLTWSEHRNTNKVRVNPRPTVVRVGTGTEELRGTSRHGEGPRPRVAAVAAMRVAVTAICSSGQKRWGMDI